MLLPWFDTAATLQAERLRRQDDPFQQFCKKGIRPNFKGQPGEDLVAAGERPAISSGAITGSRRRITSPTALPEKWRPISLAGRTCAFRLDRKEWDDGWLRQFRVEP
jgi:hypothetical protein